MASPPESSGLKVPSVRLISRAPASPPAAFWILAISALETVESAVTTTLPAALSTYQAVPATSVSRTASAALVSSAELNVALSPACADGVARAPTAARPAARATRRVRLATLLRGWCA